MNGPKVGTAALVKLGQMLETPRISHYYARFERLFGIVITCRVRTISRKG